MEEICLNNTGVLSKLSAHRLSVGQLSQLPFWDGMDQDVVSIAIVIVGRRVELVLKHLLHNISHFTQILCFKSQQKIDYAKTRGAKSVRDQLYKTFLNGPARLLFRLFSFFQKALQFMQQIYVKNVHLVYNSGDSNPRPSVHQSPPITTRPWAPAPIV